MLLGLWLLLARTSTGVAVARIDGSKVQLVRIHRAVVGGDAVAHFQRVGARARLEVITAVRVATSQ